MSQSKDHAQFEAYLQGAMSSEEGAAFEAALLEDENLLAAFEGFSRQQTEQALEPTLVPPADFTDSVRERIRRRSGGRFFQEDLVVSRYIPVFVLVAFVLLVVFAVTGRYLSLGGLSPEEPAVVEQGEGPPSAVEESEHTGTIALRRSRTGEERRAASRSNREVLTVEEEMRPASASIPYDQLPVSGRRTMDNVRYLRNVTLLRSEKSAEELRAEIESVFGRQELVEADGYFLLLMRERDLQGALQRLRHMDGKVVEESQQVGQDELGQPSLRFYYDSTPSEPSP